MTTSFGVTVVLVIICGSSAGLIFKTGFEMAFNFKTVKKVELCSENGKETLESLDLAREPIRHPIEAD